jgi:hypothetical protein
VAPCATPSSHFFSFILSHVMPARHDVKSIMRLYRWTNTRSKAVTTYLS